MENYDEIGQVQGRLYHVANQIENMQWELARLLQETQVSNQKINALSRYLINPATQNPMKETLAECLTQAETNQEKLDELVGTVKKLSRTQYKANTLRESQDQQMADAMAALRDLATKRDEHREAQRREIQQQIARERETARSELAADFLPVLDGLDLALAHRMPEPEPREPESSDDVIPGEKPVDQSSGFLRKLFRGAPSQPVSHSGETAASSASAQELSDLMRSWLHGLEIVRERFVQLLAAEGIEPIPDLGEPFNPHLHVALDTEVWTDIPENQIVAVVRKGYQHGDHVLRYAEVIVAKAPPAEPAAQIPEENADVEAQEDSWNEENDSFEDEHAE